MEIMQELVKLDKLWKNLHPQSVVWKARLSSREHALVVEEITNATGSTKSKCVNYKESDKLMIAKYGNIHGPPHTIAKHMKQFPNLTENTVCKWIAKYRKKLSTAGNNQIPISIREKPVRPSSLPVELNAMLRKFIVCLHEAGGNINRQLYTECLWV